MTGAGSNVLGFLAQLGRAAGNPQLVFTDC